MIAKKITAVRLAQEFGWTLDYIESLDELTKAEIFGVLDGQAKIKKAQNKPNPKGRRS